MDVDAPLGAVAKVIGDQVAQVVDVHHDVVKAVLFEQEDQVLHHGPVDNGNERLGDVAGQGVKAGTHARRQNHSSHKVRCS